MTLSNVLLHTSTVVLCKHIEGTINYPISFPKNLPSGSCLIIELKDILKDKSYIVNYQLVYDPVKEKDTKYALTLPDDTWQPKLSQGLGIFATINNGWCAGEPQLDKLHLNDYVTKKQYVISTKDIVTSGEVMIGPTIEIQSN